MGKNNKAGKTAKKAPWATKLPFKALPDDIIIPWVAFILCHTLVADHLSRVMGPTGVGKSTVDALYLELCSQ